MNSFKRVSHLWREVFVNSVIFSHGKSVGEQYTILFGMLLLLNLGQVDFSRES